MTEQDDTRQKSRRDLLLVLLILPLGVLCMFMTGQVAISLVPNWVLVANMRSLLDPNANFAARGNQPFIEPLNADILTQPAWGNSFLTPNASIPTRVIVTVTPPPPVRTPPPLVLVTPDNNTDPTATASGPIIIPTNEGRAQADLRIVKSDNSNTYTPGTRINYTILVTNLGPDNAPIFDVIDNIPAVITGLTVNCTPASLCGTNTSSGNSISFTGANLPSTGVNQITISVSGVVAPGATGDLLNIAEIIIPDRSRYRDPNLSNNTVTDTDQQLSIYELAITKDDGVGVNTYTATNPINYTIVVTNSGPSDALGINITDNIPPQIASWNWMCITEINASGCNGVSNSLTNFTDTVNIQSGGRIEYSVRAIPAGIAQNISNTASITIPSGPRFIDPNLSNNSATDTNIPVIDLQITKDDGVSTYTPPGPVTYTISVTNNSTFNLTGITISDPKPAQITTWSWSCASGCTPDTNSNSNFTDTINLAAGSSLVYTVTANITGALGLANLTNTATVSVPAGLVDAVPGDNSATDIDSPSIDLQITKDDRVLTYTPGGFLQYIASVTNNSAFDFTGVSVTDNMPPLISSWTWTCAPAPGSPGASCAMQSGTGNINSTVNLPAGASVNFTIDATVSTTATGALTNTATVSPPTGIIDTVPGNNTATDTDALYISDPTPPEIGTTPDNNYYPLPTGGALTLSITTVVNGHAGPDLVYYEYVNAGEVYLDWIQIQVGDGINWYTVFYWGNEIADTNSNMNFNTLLPPVNSPLPPPNEPDQRHIQAADLTAFPPSGVTIDLDGYAPPGTYPYLRIIAPAGDSDGHLEIDAILPLP